MLDEESVTNFNLFKEQRIFTIHGAATRENAARSVDFLKGR